MTRPYFYEHENDHAPERDNGKKFWGYPKRTKKIRLIVIHTAENIPDIKGRDDSAENVAHYGTVISRPASWHKVCDSDSLVTCLPDRAVAFHVKNYNSISLGVELATQAWRWSKYNWAKPNKAWHHWKILNRAAWITARWAYDHNIRIGTRMKPKSFVDSGRGGVTTHSRLDPTRRTDPGKDFPERRFLRMARRRKAIVATRRKNNG